MTDGQMLLAVFAAFYLTECLHWLPLGSSVLSTWAMRRGWRIGKPSSYVGGRGSGLALAWPLPPLGAFLLVQSWPVIPDEHGLWIGKDQPGEGRRLLWAEVQKPRLEDLSIRLAAGVHVKCESKRAAALLMAFLEQVTSASGAKRQAVIERFWHTAMSVPGARADVRRYQLAASMLRVRCLLVFALCFAWLPYLFWRHSSDTLRMAMGFASLLLADAYVAFTWRYLDKRLSRQPKKRRWPQVLHLLFMPVHAMRAHDLIGVDALAGRHPLVAAAALLPREGLRELMSKTWRTWRWCSASNPMHGAAQIVIPRLETCWQRLGFTLAELEATPPQQPDALSYCPCCHEQYTLPQATCQSCDGVDSMMWPKR